MASIRKQLPNGASAVQSATPAWDRESLTRRFSARGRGTDRRLSQAHAAAARPAVYYLPWPVLEADLAVIRHLDRLHLEFPFAGSRMLRGLMVAEGCKIGRRHVKTLMQRMAIGALCRRPRTTKLEPGNSRSRR